MRFIILTTISILLITGVAQAGNWPMAYHDLARTGTTDEVVEPPLELLWKYKTGDKIISSPAVSDGIAYVGSNDGYLYALDAKDGSLKWKYGIGGINLRSSPAVSDGIIYVGSIDDYVYALDAKDGSLKWKYGTGDNVQSSPAVSDGIVYIVSYDGYVYTLDAKDGSLKWKREIGPSISSLAISDGIVYISNYAGYSYLNALDAATGTIKWKSEKIGSRVDSSPAVSDGTVYIGSNDNYVYALNAEDGRLKWKYKTEYTIMSSPAVSEGTIYIGASDNYVYALNAEDGRLKWKYKTGYVVQSSPAVSGDTIYIGSGDNFLYALDAVTGTPKWKYETGDKIQYSSPAVSNGAVYVGSWDGYLYAFVPAKKADAFLTAQDDLTPTHEKTSEAAPSQTPSVPYTPPPQQNKSKNPTMLFGSIAILIGFILLARKSSKKKQETPKATSPMPKPTMTSVSHETQEDANHKQKQIEIRRLVELRNDASSKLERAKGMLNKAGQLGIDTFQLKDILSKAEQAYQKENYTHTIEYVKNYFALIDVAEKNKRQLEHIRKNASEQIKSAKSSLQQAERLGATAQHAEELNSKAQFAFDANDYSSALSYAKLSRDAVEQLINESKPSISIELPPKMHHDAWKHHELIIRNEGTIHAVAITITFLTALEVRELKIIKRLDVGERKTINVNIKPTENGEVPVDYSVEFKDLMDRVYKTEDTAIIQITKGTEVAPKEQLVASGMSSIDIKRGFVVLENEDIRFGIRIKNISKYTINDIDVLLKYDRDSFAVKGKGIEHLGNISYNKEKTAEFILSPLPACVYESEINAVISYVDASGNSHTDQMHSKALYRVSAYLAEKPMNEGEFSELYSKNSCHLKGIVFKGITAENVANYMIDLSKNGMYVVKNSQMNGSHVIYLSSTAKDKSYYLLTAIIRNEDNMTHIGLRTCSNNESGINNYMNKILSSLRNYINSVQSAREVENVIVNKSIQLINSTVEGAVSIEGDASGKDESINIRSKR